MRAVIGLISDTWQRQDMILRIWNGAKHPFGHSLPFRNTGTESCSRGALLGQQVSAKSTDQVEQITICDVQDIKICRSIDSGSRTWRAINQLQRSQDNEINPALNGPSTTTNTNTLQQHDSSSYCQWHRENTTITLNGDAFFLGNRASQDGRFWRAMPPRTRKYGQLPKKTTSTKIMWLWLVPAQDRPFFYTCSHFSALQNCALLFSTNFQFIFIF